MSRMEVRKVGDDCGSRWLFACEQSHAEGRQD